MSSDQQKQEFNNQNENLPIEQDDKISNDFDDSSPNNQSMSSDKIQYPPQKQAQKQPSSHDIQISNSQNQNTMIEDKNLIFYNTTQVFSSTSSETPKKLKSNLTQSKKHPFPSDISQQFNRFNEKQPMSRAQHEEMPGYSSQRQKTNVQENISEGIKKFGSLRNIRKIKTQIQIEGNSSSFSPFYPQQLRSSSEFVGGNLDATNTKEQVISDNDESKKQQKNLTKTSSEQERNFGSDHELLLNHDSTKHSKSMKQQQVDFFQYLENNYQKSQLQQPKNIGLFQESKFPVSSLTKVDGTTSNSTSQLCSHRSLNITRSAQKCIESQKEEQKEEQKNQNENNSENKQVQNESEQQQQQQQGDIQAQDDLVNQNERSPPIIDIPNTETDNQISELHNQIEIRVQSINSLTRLIQQKQVFSKLKIFGYYLPLCIAFFSLGIYQAVNFCSAGIMIHLCLYFVLSVRNFFSVLRFDKLCRYHLSVLSSYQKCSINHRYLFSLVSCLQKVYKKNDQEQKLKQEKKNTEIKEVLSEKSKIIQQFSDRNPRSQTEMEQPNDMVKEQELKPKVIHLSSENIENQECQNYNKHTQGQQLHLIMSNKKSEQQEIEKPISQEAVAQEKDEKMQESSKNYPEIRSLSIFSLMNRDLLKLILISMPNVSLESNSQSYIHLNYQLNEIQLRENVDQVIQVFESVMYSETSTTIDREVDLAMKYPKYLTLGKAVYLFCLMEDWYFVIYNILLLTMDFCTDHIQPAILVFAFLYSIALWVKIIIVTFSVAFMLVALIFFLFYKLFSYKPKPTLPSISFKDAREKIVATGKSSEQEIKDAACIICYEEFTDKDLVFLSPCCLKCYHKTCIKHWIEKSINCPLCRTPFKNQ